MVKSGTVRKPPCSGLWQQQSLRSTKKGRGEFRHHRGSVGVALEQRRNAIHEWSAQSQPVLPGYALLLSTKASQARGALRRTYHDVARGSAKEIGRASCRERG